MQEPTPKEKDSKVKLPTTGRDSSCESDNFEEDMFKEIDRKLLRH